MQPLVTVPIATYNRAEFLGPCLESVLAQPYQNIEIIVVDDGSTDATPEVAARYGDRIRYVRREHRGFIETFRHASSLGRGKYETHFGDDDIISPEFIERGVAILESDPNIAKFCCDCYMIDRAGNRIGDRTYLQPCQRPTGKVSLYDLFEYGCFVHGGIDRRSALEEMGGYHPEFARGADYDLYMRMTGAGYDIFYLNEPLWSYRIHPGMLSHHESVNWVEIVNILECNLKRFPHVRERLGRKIQRKLGMNKAWLSVRLFWEGEFSRSLKYGLSATRDYLPAVPIGAAQMAVSKLKGRRSPYHLGD